MVTNTLSFTILMFVAFIISLEWRAERLKKILENRALYDRPSFLERLDLLSLVTTVLLFNCSIAAFKSYFTEDTIRYIRIVIVAISSIGFIIAIHKGHPDFVYVWASRWFYGLFIWVGLLSF